MREPTVASSPHRVPVGLLALTAVVRLALAVAAISYSGDPSLFSSPDTSTYLEPVESLLAGEFRAAGEPEIRRTPGYPLLLVPGLMLGHATAVTIALQIVLSIATAWLVHRLSLLVFRSTSVAWWAVLLYALEPLSILLSVKLLSETLFTFLFLLGLYGVFRFVRERRWAWLLGAALALAAAVYVRPIAYYLPLVLLPFLALGPDGRVSRGRAAGAACFAVVCIGLIGAWQVRNLAVAGYPRFSGNEDVNLWLYSLALEGEEEGGGFLRKKAEMGGGPIGYWNLHPEQWERPLSDRLAALRDRARATIARRPVRYAAIHLAGCANALFNPGARGLLGLFVPEPSPATPAWLPLALVLAAVLFATYVFAVVGWFAALRSHAFAALFLLAVIGYLALLSGGPIGTSRYRQPLMPLFGVLAGAGVVTLQRARSVSWPRATKAATDVAGASLGLLVAMPLLAAVAVAVRVSLGRPVLFRQRRPGLHGVPFELVKFRTMRAGDGDDASRLTALGRFLRSTSLDELPGLWNVVRGDMSLVGPRPLLMEYLSRYTPEQARRHEAKPGLTGWAQVNGRNTTSWHQRLGLDVWYVDHWSLALDLRILLSTPGTVVARRGITAAGSATMPRFEGAARRPRPSAGPDA